MVKARVLVIDDDPSLLQVLELLLEHEGYEVITAADGAAGLARAADSRPDLILLDIMMAGLDGYEVLQRLRARPGPSILMLTARRQEGESARALDSGADDYISKPFSNGDLLARIRKELRRAQRFAEPSEVVSGDLCVNLDTGQVRLGNRPVKLRPLEWRILRTLITHPGRVVTTEELLRAAWVEGGRGSKLGLKVQIHHLRRALQDSARAPRWITSERNNGYRFHLAGAPASVE